MFEGLFIGLSVGASCLASCGPLIMSVIMKNSSTTTKSYGYLGKFMCGRLIAYIIIAFLISLLCQHEFISKEFLAVLMMIVGFMMIANAFFKMPSYCVKGNGFKTWVRKHFSWAYVSVLGFVSTLNVCPPIIAVTTTTAYSSSMFESIATFAFFFIGSSVYMLPLPLVSLVADKEALKTIGKFSSIIVGVVFIIKAILTF
ncbi:MAG: sulfite exporter TauE/SafE family protein [Bacteroidales bacterium]|nr:sulfite exporter TauE/SafE family protein [Bacteroidales bacterium]